jgi:hypothetical protein
VVHKEDIHGVLVLKLGQSYLVRYVRHVFLLLSTLNFFLSLEDSSMMLLFQLCQNSLNIEKIVFVFIVILKLYGKFG